MTCIAAFRYSDVDGNAKFSLSRRGETLTKALTARVDAFDQWC